MLDAVKLASNCIQNSQTQAQTQTQAEFVGMHEQYCLNKQDI